LTEGLDFRYVPGMNPLPTILAMLAASCLPCLPRPAVEAGEAAPAGAPRIRLDPGHAWCPPFGLDRIGRPLAAVVEAPGDGPAPRGLSLVGRRDGKEIVRRAVELPERPPRTAAVSFDPWPAELILVQTAAAGGEAEVARLEVQTPRFEADAAARPDRAINPVDLGAILFPNDRLLLAGGQGGSVEVAAVSRSGDRTARAEAWFESTAGSRTGADLHLTRDRAERIRLPLPPVPTGLDRDVLRLSIAAAGSELWAKSIPVAIVRDPPRWPRFGAARTRLRYDAPISVRADDGKLSSMDYAGAWDPALDDVVVALPTGARFVFWRGSSYVPFWAGLRNTGLSYEWAETSPPADGFTDCVEPLMDKECRYGRVRIVESTPARVRVRWSYQSCDFKYKVWGDSALEEYCFYPDGFGTRTLTLTSDPAGDYEVSEFIVLTPAATYPFSVLPSNLVDILFIDGVKRELRFPFDPAAQGDLAKPRGMPAVYRVRMHADEPLAAVYFNPLDTALPPTIFGPFQDAGRTVTPCYWGSHWPLARGKTTGWSIDDRIHLTPCHNSVMSWARTRPTPLRSARLVTLDALGRSRPMLVQTWTWLIGMTGADDAALLERARSFSAPPGIAAAGARLGPEAYAPERRAIRLVVEDRTVTLTLEPKPVCVDPVLELAGAPRALTAVTLAGVRLPPERYAWDGETLWIDATLRGSTELRLEFEAAPATPAGR
jgi:hypothetical protein